MNKYYQLLKKILKEGQMQSNKKGDIYYLLNQTLSLSPLDLLNIFDEHKVARQKLRTELKLYCEGIEEVATYQKHGITWWDYVGSELTNSYPKYFSKLPELINKINAEKRSSKNYVLFIGETGVETAQLPCLSLIQFQIDRGELVISVYQRSADANLGLPSDIYQVYQIAKQIDVPLKNITFFIGNAHIYSVNEVPTRDLLEGKTDVTFTLCV